MPAKLSALDHPPDGSARRTRSEGLDAGSFGRRAGRRRSSCLAGLAGLCALACAEAPAPREAYAGTPVRARLNAECGPELVDTEGKPCVQIDVFGEGEGEVAREGDFLTLHYLVLLPDGSELDSSHDRKALKFRLGRSSEVIEGMHLGLEGARAGERRRFVVPPPLAYRGQKLPGIPPDANLSFLVELVGRRSEL